jgi:hypothetical protein
MRREAVKNTVENEDNRFRVAATPDASVSCVLPVWLHVVAACTENGR